MKKTVIRMAAVVIAVIIMLCPLATAYAVEAGVAAGTEEVLYLVWETLKAWGINILEDGVSEFSENVQNWLRGGLAEYLEDELYESFESWITGMQWFYDNFGRRIMNSLGLNRVNNFAQWFAQRYGLTDNSSTNVSGGITVNSLTAYYLPISAPRESDPTIYNEYDHYSGTNGEYALFAIRTTNGVDHIYIYILNDFSSTVKDIKHYGTNNESISYHNLSYNSTYQKFLWMSSGYPLTGNSRWVWDAYIAYPEDDVVAALSYAPVPESNIDIVTHDITYPADNPDYQPGYSIIYFPDGSVGYIDIEWPSTISVDNLPAIVSTGTISNPGIQSVFLPIKAFINTFSEGFGLMTQLIYNLPSEIVGMALAIMGGIIIFGTIRIMKEH